MKIVFSLCLVSLLLALFLFGRTDRRDRDVAAPAAAARQESESQLGYANRSLPPALDRAKNARIANLDPQEEPVSPTANGQGWSFPDVADQLTEAEFKLLPSLVQRLGFMPEPQQAVAFVRAQNQFFAALRAWSERYRVTGDVALMRELLGSHARLTQAYAQDVRLIFPNHAHLVLGEPTARSERADFLRN